MAQLAISQETRANAVVLWLDGCLSLEDVDSFDHTLEQARRTAGDFSGSGFPDEIAGGKSVLDGLRTAP